MYEDHYQAVPIVKHDECSEGYLDWYADGYIVSFDSENPDKFTIYNPDGVPTSITRTTANKLVSAIVSATTKMEK